MNTCELHYSYQVHHQHARVSLDNAQQPSLKIICLGFGKTCPNRESVSHSKGNPLKFRVLLKNLKAKTI